MTRPPGPDRPLYMRLAAVLRNRILAQAYPPGTRLPGEEALASALGVSRSTIRQALAELRATGYITSRRGSGNYVAPVLPIEPLSPQSGPIYTGFLDDLADEATRVRERHRSHRREPAGGDIAERLRIPTGTETVRYEAIRERDGVVYGFATDVVPVGIASGITPEILERSATIPDALELAGSRVAESLQRLEPGLLDASIARRSGVQASTPVLVITGVAYDDRRIPVDAYSLTIIGGYSIGLALTRAVPEAPVANGETG